MASPIEVLANHDGILEIGFNDKCLRAEALVQQIGIALLEAGAGCNYSLFLNFRGVDFFSSAMIFKLCALYGRAVAKHGKQYRIVFCGLHAGMADVFRITRMNRDKVRQAANRQAALAAIRSLAPPLLEEVQA